jgi:hypothetical protein
MIDQERGTPPAPELYQVCPHCGKVIAVVPTTAYQWFDWNTTTPQVPVLLTFNDFQEEQC